MVYHHMSHQSCHVWGYIPFSGTPKYHVDAYVSQYIPDKNPIKSLWKHHVCWLHHVNFILHPHVFSSKSSWGQPPSGKKTLLLEAFQEERRQPLGRTGLSFRTSVVDGHDDYPLVF